MEDQLGEWARTQYLDKYAWHFEDGTHEEWPDTARRVVKAVLGHVGMDRRREAAHLIKLIEDRKFLPGGRYLASSGRPLHQVQNCTLYRCEDSREGWADLVRKAIMALSTGSGIGVDYSNVRPRGSIISTTRGLATGPLSPAQMVNETARHVMSGGFRRSAIWGGLRWDHADIFEWISIKDWSEDVRALKEKDYNAAAPLDMTNISVILNDEFFEAYHNEDHEKHQLARDVYKLTIEGMVTHGEPGFSIDVGKNAGETLRNACTEITSADDSDICNLGSINMARIDTIEEFKLAVSLGSLFLLAGTEYSDVPHDEIKVTREKNRRLGLGLMGIHEWLIKRGYRYEMVDELREWLEVYQQSTGIAAYWADFLGISRPIKTRAIAPNGTIGIIAETTTSAEPVFVAAYKRRFRGADGQTLYQYVLDPTVVRMRDQYGIDPDEIDTAYGLAYDYERRIRFQAELQEYVDHGISSTINLPEPLTDETDQQLFAETLLEYLPRLRGVTAYPNGARAGQPITAVPWSLAEGQVGVTMLEDRDEQCSSGVCGV